MQGWRQAGQHNQGSQQKPKSACWTARALMLTSRQAAKHMMSQQQINTCTPYLHSHPLHARRIRLPVHMLQHARMHAHTHTHTKPPFTHHGPMSRKRPSSTSARRRCTWLSSTCVGAATDPAHGHAHKMGKISGQRVGMLCDRPRGERVPDKTKGSSNDTRTRRR